MKKPTYYGDYLQLNKLLDAQYCLSKDHGEEAHDEMLFILVHQVYELWFKQIIHEIKSSQDFLSAPKVDNKQLSVAVARLERIKKIQALLLEQLGVMETMTPMDFLEFRDLLVPASGFQSVQFREIEVRMGLRTHQRKEVDREYFLGRLKPHDQEKILKVEKEKSLFELVELWLERMPFTKLGDFDFWKDYQASVEQMLEKDQKVIEQNFANLSPENQQAQLENLKQTKEMFLSIVDEEKYEKYTSKEGQHFSLRALQNALFIFLYRGEPLLNLPFSFLTNLMDIDEAFTTWRYRHALMAQRMLGTKIGTGGSSGHEYLKNATENNRVFVDLFNLSTFLIPRNLLPKLPDDLLFLMQLSK